MLEILPAPDHVAAYHLSGTLGEADYDRVIEDIEAKLVFLAQSMRAKLLTTDTNLAQMAKFQGVPWLNVHALEEAVRPELVIGESIALELTKPGKDEGQAVGHLPDGTLVVVNNARAFVGKRVTAEIIGVLPGTNGKMIFANLLGEATVV